MKTLKSYTLTGVIFVSVLGTLLHFAYGLSGNNVLVGLFTPTSESTWEHMKLIFFPMLLYGVWISSKLNGEYPCITSAVMRGTLLGTALIPIIFYTYSGVLGFHTAVLDILTFYISVVIAFSSIYRCTLCCCAEKFKKILIWVLFILGAMFFIFSIYTPALGIFREPM